MRILVILLILGCLQAEMLGLTLHGDLFYLSTPSQIAKEDSINSLRTEILNRLKKLKRINAPYGREDIIYLCQFAVQIIDLDTKMTSHGQSVFVGDERSKIMSLLNWAPERGWSEKQTKMMIAILLSVKGRLSHKTKSTPYANRLQRQFSRFMLEFSL